MGFTLVSWILTSSGFLVLLCMPHLIRSPFLTHDYSMPSHPSTDLQPLLLHSHSLLMTWLHVSLGKEKQLEKNFHKLQTTSPYWHIYQLSGYSRWTVWVPIQLPVLSSRSHSTQPRSTFKLLGLSSKIKHLKGWKLFSSGCLLGQHLFWQLGTHTIWVVNYFQYYPLIWLKLISVAPSWFTLICIFYAPPGSG